MKLDKAMSIWNEPPTQVEEEEEEELGLGDGPILFGIGGWTSEICM